LKFRKGYLFAIDVLGELGGRVSHGRRVVDATILNRFCGSPRLSDDINGERIEFCNSLFLADLSLFFA